MKLLIGFGLALLLISGLSFAARAPQPITEDVPDRVKPIFYDAKVYERNWMNWTVTDWALTLLAAGTAITAAVKNAFSTHNLAQAQAAASAAGVEAPVQTSGKIDKWVMVFAALTIIATTLDSKMHAAQQVERYRMGDLILQDALMDYRVSKKTEPDDKPLLDAWHQAQKILEGVPPTQATNLKQDATLKSEPALSPANPEDHTPPPAGIKANHAPQKPLK